MDNHVRAWNSLRNINIHAPHPNYSHPSTIAPSPPPSPSPRSQLPTTGSHLLNGRPHRIRGWALVRWAGARLAQRRYLRLVHYALTVFDGANENHDLVLLEQILVGTRVTTNARKYEIVIRTSEREKIVVSVRTAKEFDAWKAGFTDAAREPERFYTLVRSRKLGSGAFSDVFFGFDRDNGDHAAIKVVDKRECSRALVEHAETEARVMAVVNHPAIISCRDIFDGPNTLHVVLEFMSGGTLEDKIKEIIQEHGHVSEHIAATVIERILSAIVYLDSEGICHRDIKPDNILIGATKSSDNSRNPSLSDADAWATTVRVSDFGLAAFVKPPGRGLLTDFVGTPEYVAPEVLARCADNSRVGYGTAVDVWAAGIITYWMLSAGSLPFDGDDTAKICRAIRECKLEMKGAIWDKVSPHAKSFIRSLIQPCPRTRLTAASALMHPWMLRSRGEKRFAVYAASASAFAISRATGPPRARGNVFSRRRLTASSMMRMACVAVKAANRLSHIVLGVSLKQNETMIGGGRNSLASTLSSPALSTGSVSDRAGFNGRSSSQGYIGGSGGNSVLTRSPQSTHSERMVPAPEKAPIGTDGLGYNVGLFRSFAPKQRLRSGAIEQMKQHQHHHPQQPQRADGHGSNAGLFKKQQRLRSGGEQMNQHEKQGQRMDGNMGTYSNSGATIPLTPQPYMRKVTTAPSNIIVDRNDDTATKQTQRSVTQRAMSLSATVRGHRKRGSRQYDAAAR